MQGGFCGRRCTSARRRAQAVGCWRCNPTGSLLSSGQYLHLCLPYGRSVAATTHRLICRRNVSSHHASCQLRDHLLQVVALLSPAKKRRLQRNNSAPLSPRAARSAEEPELPELSQKRQPRVSAPHRTVTFSSLPAAAASASAIHGWDASESMGQLEAARPASAASFSHLRQHEESVTSQCSAASAGWEASSTQCCVSHVSSMLCLCFGCICQLALISHVEGECQKAVSSNGPMFGDTCIGLH